MTPTEPARSPIVLLLHDGFYGCGTGAGQSNRTLLQQLLAHAPAGTQFVIMPVWLDPSSGEYDRTWHAATEALLAGTNAVIEPVDNGTDGQVRFGGIANFHNAADDAARRLHRRYTANRTRPWIIALDVPFLELGATLQPELARRLVLVPRSSAKIHAPADVDRIAWELAALRTATERGARVAAISGFMRNHLHSDYAVGTHHILDLPDGLVDADWQPPAAPATQLSPRAANGFLLAMGRATQYKGFDDLLDALGYLRRHDVPVPHAVLAAVTDGPGVTSYQRHLQRRIHAEDLDASLITTFTLGVRALLWHPALAAVVVPSRAEPFGRIPMEAYAAGAAPVVSTTAGGLDGQVVNGLTGFTSPPHEPRSLALALRRALDLPPARRSSMRDQARLDARNRFDHGAAVRAFLRALHALGTGATDGCLQSTCSAGFDGR